MTARVERRWALQGNRRASISHYEDGHAVLLIDTGGLDVCINLNREDCAGLADILMPPKRDAFQDEKEAAR